jgi:NitT/TauT family transport system permease protein
MTSLQPTVTTVRMADESALQIREVAIAQRRRRRAASTVLSWRGVLLVGLLVGWYYASGRLVDSLFVSNPVKVAEAFRAYVGNGQLGFHLRFTAIEMVLGYFIGAGVAIVFAGALSLSRAAQHVLRPYLMAFYATPMIALAPLIIVWFGFGLTPKVIIAGIFVFFIVFMMTMSGIESAPRELLDVARTMGATKRQVLLKIVFPSAVPNVLTALRIAIPEAMVGVIIGEFISGNRGIGYLAEAAAGRFNTAGVFAVIASILIIVLVFDSLLTLVERRLLRWRPPAVAGRSLRP